MNDQEHLVSLSEAARELSLSVSMIRKLMEQGRLNHETTPYGRAVTVESLRVERQRRIDEGRL